MIEPQLSARIGALDLTRDSVAATAFLNGLHPRGFAGVVLDEGPSESLEVAKHRAQLSDALACAGIQLHAIANTWVAGPLPDDDPGFAHAGETLALAHVLGIHDVRIGFAPQVQPESSPLRERERIRALVLFWKLLADQALDWHARLLWAVHPQADDLNVIEATLHEVDAPNFGILFDTTVMETIATASAHEHVVEGKSIKGVLGLLERFKGFIGAFDLSNPKGAGPLDWERIVPAMVDAWVPSPWWTIGATDPSKTDQLADFITNALARHFTRFAKSPSTS